MYCFCPIPVRIDDPPSPYGILPTGSETLAHTTLHIAASESAAHSFGSGKVDIRPARCQFMYLYMVFHEQIAASPKPSPPFSSTIPLLDARYCLLFNPKKITFF